MEIQKKKPEEKETEIIYFRESALQSFLSDLFSFSFLIGSFALNHYFIGSRLLSGVLLIMFLMTVYSKAMEKAKRFTSYKEMLDYLELKNNKK